MAIRRSLMIGDDGAIIRALGAFRIRDPSIIRFVTRRITRRPLVSAVTKLKIKLTCLHKYVQVCVML
jgi:hypothetical protein